MSTATVLKGSLNLGIRANDESFKHGFGTHGENCLQRRPRRLLRREDVFITLRLFVFALFRFFSLRARLLRAVADDLHVVGIHAHDERRHQSSGNETG